MKHELQALAIDVKMLDGQGNEITYSETGDDDDLIPEIKEELVTDTSGLTIKDADDEEVAEAAVVGVDDGEM